jgi:outer membrane protein TolC
MMAFIFLALSPAWAADQTAVPTISLDRCLELAMQNSKQLQQAAESVKIAQMGVQEASGGFWPTIGYKYGYLNLSPLDPINAKMLKAMQGIGYSGSVSLNQPLYTGGKLTSALVLAKIKLDSALEDQRKAKQQLIYNVKEAYYRFWLAEKFLDVAENTYDNMGRHYQKVTNLNKAGTASSFDLLQAKVQWDNQKPQVIKAKNGLALAWLNLGTLIGVEQNQVHKVVYDPSALQLPEKVEVTLQSLLDEAYQNRPEIHQIQELSELANANEKLAKAGYKPMITLSCNYALQGSDQVTLQSPAANSMTVSLTLTGIIFDGFATKARVTSAEENIKLAQIKENSLKDQIRLESAQALQSLEESLETIRANQGNLQLSQEALKQVQIRFTAGVATTSDITDTQLALEQTLNGYYQGVFFYLTGLAKLDLIAGRDDK